MIIIYVHLIPIYDDRYVTKLRYTSLRGSDRPEEQEFIEMALLRRRHQIKFSRYFHPINTMAGKLEPLSGS